MLVLSRKPGEAILIGDEIAVRVTRIGPKRGLCLVHMEEANEENRIKTRMRKSGWTRDQVLAWPKGRHFKGETLVSQDR